MFSGWDVALELQLSAYTTAHGRAGSPTHRGIEPTSSWILVRFIPAVSHLELWTIHFWMLDKSHSSGKSPLSESG